MRRGTPIGVPSSCRLFLPFWKGRVTDWSGQSNTVTKVGTPKTVEGYYGSALSFDGASDRLSVADASAINFTGDFSVECWFRPEAQGEFPLLSRRDTTGGQDDAWELVGELDSSGLTLSVTVWDSGATSDTWTVLIPCRSFRWYHVRFGFDAGAAGYLFVDGDPVLTKTTTLANVDGAGLGPLLIGGELLAGTPAWFTGRIGGVRLRAATDSSAPTLSPRLVPTRISRRQVYATDLDVAAHVQDLTWTDDTNGGWYADLDDFPGVSLILFPEDVISVRLLDGSTTTTCTEVGNVVDLDAGGDFWFTDTVNRRLYLGQDPADYDRIEVVHRFGVAQATIRRGSRVYHGAVLSEDAGERRYAWFDQAYPQGGGGMLTIARQHAAIPKDVWNERAGCVIAGQRIATRLWSPGLSWAESIPVFYGFAQEPADRDPDKVSIQTVHEGARLFGVPMTRSLADRDTYPGLPSEFEGHRFLETWGAGLEIVPCALVAVNGGQYSSGTNNYHVWKIGTHKLARIVAITDPTGVSKYYFVNADLTAATFESYADASYKLCAVVDGYGDASDPTSPLITSGSLLPLTYSWGVSGEAVMDPGEMLQAMLAYYLGFAASRFGDSWTDTATRVERQRRIAAAIEDGQALAREIQKHLAETFSFLVFTAGGLIEWYDLVKADTAAWTLTDADIISHKVIPDQRRLASKAAAEAHEYVTHADGSRALGAGVTYDLQGEFAYGSKDVWRPAGGGLMGVYNQSVARTVLETAQPFLEKPWDHHKLVVGPRFLSAEQHDKVANVSTVVDSGDGDLRIVSVKPVGGAVEIELAPEEPWPADGTSDPGSTVALGPYQFARWGDNDGPTLADTAGSWVTIDNHCEIFNVPDGLPPDLEHRLAAYARRSGGSGNSDLQFRLVEIDTDNAVVATLATISAVTTSAGFVATTTFSNVPTYDALVAFEYKTANGATAPTHALSWCAAEGGGAGISDPALPFVQINNGYRAGANVSGTSYFVIADMTLLGTFHSTQSVCRASIAAKVNGATGFMIELRESYPGNQILAHFDVTADGIHSMDVTATFLTTCVLVAKVSTGTGIIRAWSVTRRVERD